MINLLSYIIGSQRRSFFSEMQAAKQELGDKGYQHVYIPQARPLSAGEVLGCTAPTLPSQVESILFVADGRFHLEALLIANPSLPAFRSQSSSMACMYGMYVWHIAPCDVLKDNSVPFDDSVLTASHYLPLLCSFGRLMKVQCESWDTTTVGNVQV
jgi:hypothetical protein